jgi:hypothetical protein
VATAEPAVAAKSAAVAAAPTVAAAPAMTAKSSTVAAAPAVLGRRRRNASDRGGAKREHRNAGYQSFLESYGHDAFSSELAYLCDVVPRPSRPTSTPLALSSSL